MTFLESLSYLDKNQYGFWEVCRTSDDLQHIINNITHLLVTKNYCGLISFDIQRAFDSIIWHTISQIIEQSLTS